MLISVVVPCYNEGAVLPHLHERLSAVLETMAPFGFEVIYIDDGSDDETPTNLRHLTATDQRAKSVRLSRNFGQEAAITAGLTETSGDAVVIIDADLQDPPELIPQMVQRWREGWQLVFGERQNRAGEKRFKLWAAETFYRLASGLNPSISYQAGNFRLMDRAVVTELLQMPERTRFVRGMANWIGFRQIAIPYQRAPRFAGKSKYSIAKMFSLATDAVASFSFAPLRLATLAGFAVVIVSLVTLVTMLASSRHLMNATLLAVLFLGGIQLLSIGILGEYVGRIYVEAKRRPLYVVAERSGFTANERPAVGDLPSAK